MSKYLWGMDKENNKWNDIVYNNLIDKSIEPKNLDSKDKIELLCTNHKTVFTRTVRDTYNSLNRLGYVGCNKCSRIEANKKIIATNLERYGVESVLKVPEIIAKRKATNLEKYGVENTFSSPEIWDKIKKTNLEKYGTEYVILNPEVKEKANKVMIEKYGSQHAFQNKETFDKFKRTMQDKYGVDFSLQNKEIRDKFTHSMKDKYDNEHALQCEEFKQKAKNTNITKYNVEYATQSYDAYVTSHTTKGYIPVSEDIFNIVNNADLLSNYIDELTEREGISPTLKKLADSLGYAVSAVGQKITKFNLHNKISHLSSCSHGEIEIMEFLDKYNIEYSHRYNKIGPEIDIYIEKLDIGIEFNGIYWHCDIHKEKDYHLKKYLYYKDLGIRLINIYDDEWNSDESQNILKSIILSSCNISNINSIDYARKLKLVELDHSPNTLQIIRDFYDENHLQGYRNSSNHIALLDGDNIIECMSFGYPYYGNNKNKTNYQYELIRHCTKLYHNVVGGKERIFKYFLNNYPYDKKYNNYIITYCDIDKFTGKSYEKLGFKYINHKIQVWSVNEHRTQRLYRNPKDNEKFKELPKIYGCGNNVYIYNI